MKYPIGTKVRVVKIPHGLDEDDAPLYAEGDSKRIQQIITR